MATPNTISHVYGQHNGCFVACVAMLFGIDYEAAFKKVHPTRYIYDSYGGGIAPIDAFNLLKKWGWKPRLVPISKSILTLKQTAIIWVRWYADSPLMHSIVYESTTNKFWDPGQSYPLSSFRMTDRLKENVVVLDGYTGPEKKIVPAAPIATWIMSADSCYMDLAY